MKNITFSADENVIKRARIRANQAGTTLNELFREWLGTYAKQEIGSDQYRRLMKQFEYAKPGKHYSREELNAR